MTTKIISLINLKGGVAKTTTTIQLAECLASEFSKRVLVIDLDPQTNATVALIGEDNWDIVDQQGQTIYHLFSDILKETNTFDINIAIQKKVSNLQLSTLDLLSSSVRLIDIQDKLVEINNKNDGALRASEVLKVKILGKLKEYDYVLIDCPPTLGNITKNGLEISDYFLIPTIPDKLSTYGIPQILQQVNTFKKNRKNCHIEFLGVVFTKYQTNSKIHQLTIKEFPFKLKKWYNDNNIDNLKEASIFATKMPQANQIAEAMNFNNVVKTFKQKYGYGQLNSYIIELTQEILSYV